MTPAADKITSSCNSIKPVMNTKKAPVKKEEVPVFLKKVSAVICYQHLLLSRSRASDITAASNALIADGRGVLPISVSWMNYFYPYWICEHGAAA